MEKEGEKGGELKEKENQSVKEEGEGQEEENWKEKESAKRDLYSEDRVNKDRE